MQPFKQHIPTIQSDSIQSKHSELSVTIVFKVQLRLNIAPYLLLKLSENFFKCFQFSNIEIVCAAEPHLFAAMHNSENIYKNWIFSPKLIGINKILYFRPLLLTSRSSCPEIFVSTNRSVRWSFVIRNFWIVPLDSCIDIVENMIEINPMVDLTIMKSISQDVCE